MGEAPLRPLLPLCSSVVRPGAQARRVAAGLGAGGGRRGLGYRGVACGQTGISPTPGPPSLPAEAGSACGPGGKTNPVGLGRETVARKCN